MLQRTCLMTFWRMSRGARRQLPADRVDSRRSRGIGARSFAGGRWCSTVATRALTQTGFISLFSVPTRTARAVCLTKARHLVFLAHSDKQSA